MAMMNSLNSYHYFTTRTASIVIILLHLFLSLVSSLNQAPQPPSISSRGVLVEKSRLGSIPPSCHNKCNDCHPCMAVQVPTLPRHDRIHPGLTRAIPSSFFDPSHQGKSYTNYKPLGWKCHCGNHFFNP
ncbi:EPIDERMAL PATTERNING FACTOR-like protein [Quillaja saponaria]|uniref:Epidermal patterning factor-like protein n=1 Tax=Quillaja saponaria TaxID=32244 RepID=A0AAD7KUM0_QUISA|nr:EPIDERMAL PATTERNING FACTOR-like protein [Quillaja saponaria]